VEIFSVNPKGCLAGGIGTLITFANKLITFVMVGGTLLLRSVQALGTVGDFIVYVNYRISEFIISFFALRE